MRQYVTLYVYSRCYLGQHQSDVFEVKYGTFSDEFDTLAAFPHSRQRWISAMLHVLHELASPAFLENAQPACTLPNF